MKTILFSTLSLLTALTAHAQTPVRIADTFANNSLPGYVTDQRSLTVYNNKLYYLSDTGATAGNQHWWHMLSYDGSNPISMAPEAYSKWIEMHNGSFQMAQLNGKLYFLIQDCHIYPTRPKIVVFDSSSPINLAPSQALDTFAAIYELTAAGNNLYFTGSKPGNPPVGGLWYYNGSGLASRINLPQGALSGADPANLYTHNGKLYFSSLPNATIGAMPVLFELNPVNNSFRIVKSPAYPNGIQQPRDFASIDGKLYFTATDTSGYQMYSFDGTIVKKLTFLDSVSKQVGGPYCKYREEIFFQATGKNFNDTADFYTYNVNTGVVRMSATIRAAVRNTRYTEMIVYKNKLYFTATNSSGTELWRFDGQAVSMVADINPGAASMTTLSNRIWPTIYKNNLYFFANNGVSRELYRLYDATGIQQHSWSGSVTAYPNPTSTSATIGMSLQSQQSISVVLTDIQGRAVWSSAIQNYPVGKSEVSIPIQSLVPGQYIYHLRNDKGQLLASGMLLRQ